MGSYTKLVMDIELDVGVGDDAFEILEYMLGLKDKLPDVLPDHPLFSTHRWKGMLRSASYSFNPPTPRSKLIYDEHTDYGKNRNKGWYLSINCNLKNYDSEIEHFIDWIKHFVDAYDGDFLGYHLYEHSTKPTLIYYKKE